MLPSGFNQSPSLRLDFRNLKKDKTKPLKNCHALLAIKKDGKKRVQKPNILASAWLRQYNPSFLYEKKRSFGSSGVLEYKVLRRTGMDKALEEKGKITPILTQARIHTS